jgi:hypothetical protein
MTEEILKNIVGFDRYQISNIGRVFNTQTNKFLEPCVNKGYYVIKLYDDNNIRKNLQFHRLIAIHFIDNPNNYKYVDHIDQDKLNNNINNLRWCSASQNAMNKKKYKNNTSNFKGVLKRHKKFIAQIKFENITYHIGSFDDLNHAAYSYNIASKLLFKKFACLNLIEEPDNYLQLKYLVYFKLSKHFYNLENLVEKYKDYA